LSSEILDYVGGRAVAALVYRHGVHLVDAFVWPDGSPAAMHGVAHADARRGYNLVHWSANGMTYWVASGMDPVEMERLQVLMADARPM